MAKSPSHQSKSARACLRLYIMGKSHGRKTVASSFCLGIVGKNGVDSQLFLGGEPFWFTYVVCVQSRTANQESDSAVGSFLSHLDRCYHGSGLRVVAVNQMGGSWFLSEDSPFGVVPKGSQKGNNCLCSSSPILSDNLL